MAMAKSSFWSGFTWGVLSAAGAGLGVYAASHFCADASEGKEKDRQFSLSSPPPNQQVRRDLLEVDGSLLEGIRGGEHGMDRKRVDADKNDLYSPGNPPKYGAQKSPSAG